MGMDIKLPPDLVEKLEAMARDRNTTMLQVLNEQIGYASAPGDAEKAKAELAEIEAATATFVRLFGRTLELSDKLREERDAAVAQLPVAPAIRAALSEVLSAARTAHSRSTNYPEEELPTPLFSALNILGARLKDYEKAGGV